MYGNCILLQYSVLIGGRYVFDKNEIKKINEVLQANALDPNIIGPTLPPVPPFTLPTGPT
ncbi:exosporium leader peptide-containing protein, partial [Bacillus wiedmannii]|uniref:exosporium leader peptide-containing protein n=1 Tax=Bacillus wiedmannii TaxID=1890302 RepID=UPI002E1D5087|nr:exosporium leader peptide-containing protein [Bacillus wiedmannii]